MEKERKYALWGSMKIMQDFMYIYRDFFVGFLVCIDMKAKLETIYKGIPVVSPDLFSAGLVDEIIVCMKSGNSRNEEIKYLNRIFPSIKICTCDHYFNLYDNGIHVPKESSLYVWGTGRSAELFLNYYKEEHEIEGFIDTYKMDKEFHGKEILRFDDLNKSKPNYIVIAINNYLQIENELKSCGFQHGINFARWGELVWNPANMLRDVFFSEERYDFSCDTMLNHLEILNNGNTRTCCTTFVTADIGNYFYNDLESIWNGKKAILHRILALSTQNRTYLFCDKKMCPLFDGREKSKEASNEIIAYHEISDYPEVVALAYDKICNLACETCRKKIYVCSEAEENITRRISEKIEAEILPHCKFLIMAGDGEVFASPAYIEIWKNDGIRNLEYLRLLSNGMLFTEERWKEFKKNKKDTKIMLTVSIDAATKETYETIRRFGNFEQLQKNMEFAGKLRKNGELAYFRMNFVVQKKNIAEMKKFVQWGKKIGADKVFFTKILNWGTYTNEDFNMNISPMESDELTPGNELKEVLESQEMQDPIVDLGTIKYMHLANTDDEIKNYYMWELEKDVEGIFQKVDYISKHQI